MTTEASDTSLQVNIKTYNENLCLAADTCNRSYIIFGHQLQQQRELDYRTSKLTGYVLNSHGVNWMQLKFWAKSNDSYVENEINSIECGVEGNSTDSRLKYPWRARLYSGKTSAAERNYFCGGTLIGPRTILSAAHCFNGVVTSVYAEIGNLTDLEVVDINFFTDVGDEEQRMSGGDDLVLLYLNQVLDKTTELTPICLPNVTNIANFREENMYRCKQFHMQKKNESDVELVMIPKTCDAQCVATYGESGNSSVLCFGSHLMDAVGEKGDSGSPVVVKDIDHPKKNVLVGIVSGGSEIKYNNITLNRPLIIVDIVNKTEWIWKYINCSFNVFDPFLCFGYLNHNTGHRCCIV